MTIKVMSSCIARFCFFKQHSNNMLLVGLLLMMPFQSVYSRQVNDATVDKVYTHDCCGRGSISVVIVSGGTYSGAQECVNDMAFAIETSSPNHDAFLSIALAAQTTGKKVNVYGNAGGCVQPGNVFNKADGIMIKPN